jgi:hypothetical protein
MTTSVDGRGDAKQNRRSTEVVAKNMQSNGHSLTFFTLLQSTPGI